MEHSSAVKFAVVYEKNMRFLVISECQKAKYNRIKTKKLKKQTALLKSWKQDIADNNRPKQL